MTDAPLTEAGRAADLARYAIHDRVYACNDDLHGKLYWEDAQVIGNDLAKDYITVTESDRLVAAARHETLEAVREYLLNASRTAAAAQRQHDDVEGIKAIGTSTANETEWHQLGNWAASTLIAFRNQMVDSGMLRALPAISSAAPEPKPYDPADGYEDGLWVAALPRCEIHNARKPCPTCAGYIVGGL